MINDIDIIDSEVLLNHGNINDIHPPNKKLRKKPRI